MSLTSSARSVSDLKAHLVLVTKYRKQVLTEPMLNHLRETVSRVCQQWGCQVIEFNGESDHVHLLFQYYPQVQLSKLVNNLKTVTSRMLRKDFEAQLSKTYWNGALWTNAYFIASCGGVTVETLKRYIESQDSVSHR